MLLENAPLGLREYLMGEELPLATIFRAVADLLRGRTDAVIFGAHAVNAYTEHERMTEDVDVLSTDGHALAETIRAHLSEKFHAAFRVREVATGAGHRVYQLRSPKNRHICDVRTVASLPPFETHGDLRILAPVELIAMKAVSYTARRAKPKGATDLADLRRLILRFPHLAVDGATVAASMKAMGASSEALGTWEELRAQPVEPDDDD